MRKLATVRQIAEVLPIAGADKICQYRVDGWLVVDSVGKYNINDLVLYLEVDSWVPNSIAPFLSKGKEPREYNGVAGEHLRTVKLRKALSQGLLLPITALNENAISCYFNESGQWAVGIPSEDTDEFSQYVYEGSDVSEQLNIQLWEPPIPAQLRGDVEGLFPAWLKKSDQDRVQNLNRNLEEWTELEFEVTEKLHGSSMTVFVNQDNSGVCSRNYQLTESETNTFWVVARKEQLIEKLKTLNRNIALQGELCGEGVNGNQYNIKGQTFFLYNIYDIDKGEFVCADERVAIAQQLQVKHVPHIKRTVLGPVSVAALLDEAKGTSALNSSMREGLVYKCLTDSSISFKVISNDWLMKND